MKTIVKNCLGTFSFPWFCLITTKIWSDGQTNVTALGWTNVTTQFIQKVKENTFLSYEGMPTQKTRREERPPWPNLAPFFTCFFFSLWACPIREEDTQEPPETGGKMSVCPSNREVLGWIFKSLFFLYHQKWYRFARRRLWSRRSGQSR